MTQPALLDSLRKAHMGNYGVILSLLGCLDHGLQAKKLVDRVIDASAISIPLCLGRVYIEKWGMCCIGDHVTNLREDILIYRLKYSLASMDEAKEEDFLGKAVKALEK